mgnify:CR=1 FL=1
MELQIFKLENNDPDCPKWDFYSDIVTVAETGWEAKQLSIVKYNPSREKYNDWPAAEKHISCTEIGIAFSNFEKGDIIVDTFVRG